MVLKQFKCFADPERANNMNDIKWMGKEYKQDIDRIITVAYLSLCKIDHKINSSKYDTVDWFLMKFRLCLLTIIKLSMNLW
jgi:hypothetical protein